MRFAAIRTTPFPIWRHLGLAARSPENRGDRCETLPRATRRPSSLRGRGAKFLPANRSSGAWSTTRPPRGPQIPRLGSAHGNLLETRAGEDPARFDRSKEETSVPRSQYQSSADMGCGFYVDSPKSNKASCFGCAGCPDCPSCVGVTGIAPPAVVALDRISLTRHMTKKSPSQPGLRCCEGTCLGVGKNRILKR